MNKIIVVVKMWFDSVNGNTYHRVKLFTNINNFSNKTRINEILESDVSYGYETAYITTSRYEYQKHIQQGISRKDFVEMCEFEVINVNKKELYK